MIAVDWSYIKELTTYDGKKIRKENKETFVKRIVRKHKPELIIIEEECPLAIIHYFLTNNIQVSTINNHTCHSYHLAHGTTKTNENDACAIWELANLGIKLFPITLDNKPIQFLSLYHQYNRFQKSRIAIQNLKLAHERCYGIGESRPPIKSCNFVHPMPSLSPYDNAISTFMEREQSLLKILTGLIDTKKHAKNLNIKGIGKGLWIRLAIIANPNNFKCLSAYLRYCGLTKDTFESHRYNRDAKSMYYLMATESIRWDTEYKEMYAKFNKDVDDKHPNYTKTHLKYATLNRISTFLAKRIFEYGKTNQLLPLQ